MMELGVGTGMDGFVLILQEYSCYGGLSLVSVLRTMMESLIA